ncbi:MAG: ABC transporter permease [Chloroflexi bacterium]|nr:ABC transporter permease [Chloroflexota bacterium]
MHKFIIRRLLRSVPVLFGVSAAVFFLMRLVPGDAVDAMLGGLMREDTAAQMRRLFGLDQPIHVQYVRWLGSVLQGDLGVSLRTGRLVTAEILAVLPATVEIALFAAIAGSILGISLGLLAAIRQNTGLDAIVVLFGYLGVAIPGFWLGTLLIMVFGVWLHLLPAGGYADFASDPAANLRYALLPTTTLALPFAAGVMRITRSCVLEVLHMDYVSVARSKGLTERVVVWRHVLRNAMISIVTFVGMLFGFLLGGSVVAEAVFVRPGVGRLLLISIQMRDYAVVQGITLFFALVFMASNLVVDILYGVIDPRISVE